MKNCSILISKLPFWEPKTKNILRDSCKQNFSCPGRFIVVLILCLYDPFEDCFFHTKLWLGSGLGGGAELMKLAVRWNLRIGFVDYCSYSFLAKYLQFWSCCICISEAKWQCFFPQILVFDVSCFFTSHWFPDHSLELVSTTYSDHNNIDNFPISDLNLQKVNQKNHCRQIYSLPTRSTLNKTTDCSTCIVKCNRFSDLFCFGPQCFLWPPVTNCMLLYSKLLCKKIARTPGGHKYLC